MFMRENRCTYHFCGAPVLRMRLVCAGGSFHNPLHYQEKGIHHQLASHLDETKAGGKKTLPGAANSTSPVVASSDKATREKTEVTNPDRLAPADRDM